MEKPFITRTFLIVSGLIGICIGGALLFTPAAFQASSGISLGDDINLLNETRASGGVLFAAGFLVALGAFIPTMAHTSVVISSLFYLSYGASRVFSIIVDGVPHDTLVAATACEIVIGVLGLFLLLSFHRKQSGHSIQS